LVLLFSIAFAQEDTPKVEEDPVDLHLAFDCSKIEVTSDPNALSADVVFKGIPAEATDKVTLFCSDMPEEIGCAMDGDNYVCKTGNKECKHPRVVVLGDDEMCPLKGNKGEPLAAAVGDADVVVEEFVEAATVESASDMQSTNSNTYALPVYAWVAIGLTIVVVLAVIVFAVMAARFKKTTESV